MIVVTTAGWCLIAGIALLLSSALGLGYVLHRRGEVRRKTNQEVVDRMMRWDTYDQASYAAGRGTGVAIEANMDLNDLRHCASRGDWKLFWGFPATFFGFGFGSELIALAVAIRNDDVSIALYPALVLVPLGLIGPFMAWAALYSDIDRNGSSPAKDAWRERAR
jgi:hypothetical protein